MGGPITCVGGARLGLGGVYTPHPRVDGTGGAINSPLATVSPVTSFPPHGPRVTTWVFLPPHLSLPP